MASRAGNHGHLDATGGREVVYCHACAHEWYRDEQGLTCPRCAGEIIEIVSPEYDPRDLESDRVTESDLNLPPLRYPDSDPDEADIEEHMQGENGFVANRNTRAGANRTHHQPELEPVLNRFINMVNDFAPSEAPARDHRRGPTEQPNQRADGAFAAPAHPMMQPHHHAHDDDDDFYHPLQNHQRLHHTHPLGGSTRVHRTTFSNNPFGGGTASVTIYSNHVPIPGRRRRSQAEPGPEGAEGGDDPFNDFFAHAWRDIGAPQGQGNEPAGGHDFLSGLQDIMALFNPQNARVGDAVYSQEALDRIISNLMEANPTSNAAPPASEEGLKNLERKPVDKTMLDNQDKTECSICIDDISEGDMALFLPCKHWFHEQCVVLWLKEHNTCPICRTPIETREARREAREARLAAQYPQYPEQAGQPAEPNPLPNIGPVHLRNGPGRQLFSATSASNGGSAQAPWDSPRRAWFSMQPSNDALDRADAFAAHTRRTDDEQPLSPSQSSRPPSHRQTRLNEALRSVSAMQERHRGGSTEQGTSTGVSYDTSRMQRRNSLSPTSPRTTAPGNYASHRQRSPSQSSGRWAASDRESSGSQRQSGSGPFSWLRNRLPGGGSGSNNGSSREGRRS